MATEEEFRTGKRADGTPLNATQPSERLRLGCQHKRREWHSRGPNQNFDICLDCNKSVPALLSDAPTEPPPQGLAVVPANAIPMQFSAKATGAFVEGVHVDAQKLDNDATSLGPRVLRIQTEVADLAAEALRVRDDALKQLDALRRLTKYSHEDFGVRARAAAYDDLQTLIDDELVVKRGWTITSARDAVFQLFNDNAKLEARLAESVADNSRTISEQRGRITDLENDLRLLRHK